MNSRSMTLLISVLMMMAVSLSAQIKKYNIKSGIVRFELVIKSGSMNITQKLVVSFDDYGMKECKDKYNGDKLTESYLSDGKTLYSVMHAKKIAYKRGDAFRGTEVRFDWNDISDKDKKEGRATKIANMKVAAKDCEAYQTTTASGKSTFAGWSHILLYFDLRATASQSTMTATKIEENANIPPGKFAIPADYQVKEMGM
jgi:hypothetical protein